MPPPPSPMTSSRSTIGAARHRYRLTAAANLLRRLYWRIAEPAARGRGRGAMSGQVHTARRHDSALKHVTGQALYIDDIPEPPGTLHGALVLSPIASGRLRRLDLSVAAAAPGVVAVFAAGDIPGPQQHRRRRQGRAAVRGDQGRVCRSAARARRRRHARRRPRRGRARGDRHRARRGDPRYRDGSRQTVLRAGAVDDPARRPRLRR